MLPVVYLHLSFLKNTHEMPIPRLHPKGNPVNNWRGWAINASLLSENSQ
jgi:hypothetical protein